jgi:hypothetical protein
MTKQHSVQRLLHALPIALLLAGLGSGALFAGVEADPCGRPYPQLTDRSRCPVPGVVSTNVAEAATRALAAGKAPATQVSNDIRSILNNRGRE